MQVTLANDDATRRFLADRITIADAARRYGRSYSYVWMQSVKAAITA